MTSPQPITPEPLDPHEHDAAPDLWVRSDISPTGDYIVGFSCGPDTAWSLSARDAREHATHTVAAATAAEHDAAVFAFLTATGGFDLRAIAQVLHDVRTPRTPPPHWPGPLRFLPGVTTAGKPFVTLLLHHRPVGQQTPREAHEHAHGVLEVIAATRLDRRLHRVLTRGALALDEHAARAVVGGLSRHWPPPVWPT